MTEDFTEYTEVDIAANRIRNLTSSSVQIYQVDLDEIVYLYYDFGIGNLQRAELDCKITLEDYTSNGQAYFWMFSNYVGDVHPDPGPYLGLQARHNNNPDAWQISLYEKDASGTVYADTYYHNNSDPDEIFYIEVIWDGLTLTANIYSDAAKTNLLDTLLLTLHDSYSFRYNYALRSNNASVSGRSITFTLENMDLEILSRGSSDLSAAFSLRQETEDLEASLIARNVSSEGLKNTVTIRHSTSRDLYAKFSSQISQNIRAAFLLRAEYEGLFVRLFVPFPFEDLLAETIIRHTATPKNLKAIFTVRKSVPQWRTHEAFIDDIIPWYPTWSEEPVGLPPQRKAFRAQGRLWITYHSDDQLWFKTSLDGRTWSAAQVLRSGDSHSGEYFAVWFDGEHIHYVYGGNSSDASYYRRGEPQSDGAIVWSGPEVVARPAVSAQYYRLPNIGVDSNGYPIISYSQVEGFTFRYPYARRSSRNDGTWITVESHILTTTTGAYYTSCIPLPNGNMLVFYTRYYSAGSLKAQEWDGSSWTDRDPNGDSHFTALTDSKGTVHLVYRDRNDHKIYYMYFSEGSWSSGAEISFSDDGRSWPILALDYNETLWCFWQQDDNIHYLYKNKNGSWSEEAVYEQTHGTISYYQVSAPVEAGPGGNGFMQGTQIPIYFHVEDIEKLYVVLFEYLAPELKAVFNVGQDSAALKAEFRIAVEALPAEAVIRHSSSLEITAEFLIRSPGTGNLLSHIEIIPVKWLYAKFKIRQQYDITGWKGISFLWYGGGGWDQLVEFEIHSPMGFWRARFYDGPSGYRFVFIPLSDFTELGIDGTRPDASEITAFLWTYHTQGTRKVSDLAIWYTAVPDLLAEFMIRKPSSNTVFVKFIVA